MPERLEIVSFGLKCLFFVFLSSFFLLFLSITSCACCLLNNYNHCSENCKCMLSHTLEWNVRLL